MRINNNIMAMNTHRQYGINNNNISKSIEKLSSGYRINRAGDDAAGLAISEKMRAQIRGLQMASKNSQDAISLVQTAEGALQETHNILQRMRELAVQSASDTNETTIDRGALEQEFKQLIAELDDTANKTRFNDQNLIDGTFQKTATTLAKAAGFATSSNVHFTKNTSAGSYTHTVAYTESSEKIENGKAPSLAGDFSSTIGPSDLFSKFEIDFSAYIGSSGGDGTGLPAGIGNVEFTGVTQGEGANSNKFTLTFEVTSGAAKDYLTFTVENDAAGGISVSGGGAGYGAELSITAAPVGTVAVSNDLLLADLQAMVGTKVDKATMAANSDTASFLSPSPITAAYAIPTVALPKTAEMNGTYFIEAKDAGGGLLELTLTNAADGKLMQAMTLDMAALIGDGTNAGTQTVVDLGQFGSITLDNDGGGTINDIIDALNGKTITIANGVDPDITGKPASASVSTGKENIQLTEGMKSYTDSNGITINFKKTLTKADFATQDTLMQAIYGGTSTSATITIGAKEGRDMVIQTGANEGDDLAINIDRMDAWNLGVDLSSVSTREAASKAITEVNNAINQVSTQRAALGALQNRLDHKIANLDTSAENLQAAESRIRDLDMAKEMTEFTKNNILAQAATAMLAQANALPQGVLQLLQ